MTTQSKQRSLDQDRAKAAWECVSSVAQSKPGDADTKKFRSLARGAPADIQANGLGQTLAFWNAKREDEYRALYKAVDGWVKRRVPEVRPDLLEWIISDATTNDYRRATAEAIAFLSWVKRFAEAELAE